MIMMKKNFVIFFSKKVLETALVGFHVCTWIIERTWIVWNQYIVKTKKLVFQMSKRVVCATAMWELHACMYKYVDYICFE